MPCFCAGFPSDVKERELNNLLRFLPGYEVRSSVAAFAPHVLAYFTAMLIGELRHAGLAAASGRRQVSSGKHRDLSVLQPCCDTKICGSPCPSISLRTSPQHTSLFATQAQGFALFDCGASAQGALHRITNLV